MPVSDQKSSRSFSLGGQNDTRERLAELKTIGLAIVFASILGGCPTTPAPPNFVINVGITETQTGPDICISGQGFSPGGQARISYLGVPGQPSSVLIANTTISGSGQFTYKDFSQEGRLVGLCSNELIQQNVSIVGSDVSSGNFTTATVPAWAC